MSEAFDTSTPFGSAMVGILGVFAQLEREQIKERSMMGRKARAKEGKFHGGACIPVGYDYVDGELMINEYEAEQIRLIFEMASDNKSNQEIVNQLIESGYTTKYGAYNQNHIGRMSRVLKNELYIGTIKYGDVITKNCHPPIISENLFKKANDTREVRRNAFGDVGFRRTTLLSGFIWCAKCGARFTTTKSRNKNKYGVITSEHRYHACYSRSFPTSKMAKQKGCDNVIWKIEELENQVNQTVKRKKKKKGYFEKLTEQPVKINGKINPVKKRVDEIDRQISKLMDLYSLDTMPIETLSVKIDELHKEKESLNRKLIIKESELGSNPIKNIDEFRSILNNTGNFWELADREQKWYLLSLLVRGIYIDGYDLIFDWVFLPKRN
jgi:site-specific DNA recombinase